MRMLYILFDLLVPVVIVGVIAVAIVAWRRRDDDELEADEERGIGRPKRLYFYLATPAYMLVAGVGMVLVLRYLLDVLFGPPVISRGTEQLALGLALAVIWTPVWCWHLPRVLRFPEEEPAERRSVLRKLFFYLTLGVTMALVAQASVDLLRWVLGAKSFSGYPLAAVMVWGALWAFHWIAESAEGQPTENTRTIRRLYVYLTSALSLAMLAAGLGVAAYILLRGAYEVLFPVDVLVRTEDSLWNEPMKNSLAASLVGAALWVYHCLYVARLDRQSTLRQVYSYTFAILGGAVTVLSASGIIIFGILQWFIGTPEEASAAEHFRILPGALSALAVGACLWLYHWSTVQWERAALGQLPAARRVYTYIMVALGVSALATAIAALVSTAVGIMVANVDGVLVGTDWWRDRVVLGITLVLLGAPPWSYYWASAQRSAAAKDSQERDTFVRRLLIYGVLVGGSLILLGNLSYLMFMLLHAGLDGDLSLRLLGDVKWNVGAVVASGLFLPYYWLVLREDRQIVGERPAPPPMWRKAVMLLIPESDAAFVSQLEAVLGTKVHVLRRLDSDIVVPQFSDGDLQSLKLRITEAAGERVLLLVNGAGVQVYPCR